MNVCAATGCGRFSRRAMASGRRRSRRETGTLAILPQRRQRSAVRLGRKATPRPASTALTIASLLASSRAIARVANVAPSCSSSSADARTRREHDDRLGGNRFDRCRAARGDRMAESRDQYEFILGENRYVESAQRERQAMSARSTSSLASRSSASRRSPATTSTRIAGCAVRTTTRTNIGTTLTESPRMLVASAISACDASHLESIVRRCR